MHITKKSVTYFEVTINDNRLNNIEGLEYWETDEQGFEYKLVAIDLFADVFDYFDKFDTFNLQRRKPSPLHIWAKIQGVMQVINCVHIELSEADFS